MSAAIVVTGLAEIAKITLQIYFAQMALAGQTPEQIEAMYQAERAKFIERAPEKLNPIG
jgi:hypothetical protein